MKTIDIVKKKIIISMISILLLIITLFGITYAYFVSKVKGNENKESISVKAGKLELTYEDGNGILEVGEYLQPGEKVKFKDSNGNKVESKTFTVTNTGTRVVDTYEVILEKVINELEYYEDLTYTLTCTSYINYGEENQEEFGSCNGSNGYFPKTNGTLNSNSIDVDVTHYYVLTMEYDETHQDQSNDMQKNISAKINIQDNESSLNKLIVYGNSIQDGTPTIDNPVEIQSVGNYDESTSKYKIPLKVTGKNLLKTIGVISWDNYSVETGTSSNGKTTTDIIQNEIKNGASKFNASTYYGNDSSAYYVTLKPNTTYIYGIEYIDDEDTDSTSALDLYAYKKDQGTGAAHFIHNSSKPSENFVSTSNTNYSGYYKFTTNDTDLIYGFSTAGGIQGTGSKIVKYRLYVYEVEDEDNIDSKYVKYKENTYNIYLDQPLRKVGNHVDYIDFMNYRLVRNVGVSDDSGTKPIEESLYGLLRPIQTNIELPTLIKEDIGNIEILTSVEPSKIEY